MKNKFKNCLKLGILLFGISLFFTNCQKDDDFEDSNMSFSKPTPFVKTINFKEFLNQKTSGITIEKLNKLNKKGFKTSFNSNKNSSEEPRTITIDFSSINQIIKNGTVSYTFRIIPDTINTAFFENLIIQTNALQETNAFIIKYIPEGIYDINSPFQGVREIAPIDTDVNINPSSQKTTVCVTVTTYINHYLCDPGVEQTPENCDFQYTQEINDTTCTIIGGNNTGYSYVINNTSSGGGGGGSSSDDQEESDYDPTDPSIHGNQPILTNTNYEPPLTDPHIISLNKMMNVPEIKIELNRLKFNMGFSTQEDGKRYIYTGSNINDITTYNDSNFNEQSPSIKESDALYFPPLENNTLIGAHFHPDIDDSSPPKPIRKVPSGTDIAEHIVMVKKIAETNPTTPPDINQVTNFVVSKGNGGKTYAIRTNDEEGIVNLQGDFEIGGQKRKEIAEELGKIILAIPAGQSNTNQLQEVAIANYLSENFPGLSIYVAVYNQAGEIINWVKL
ncbi:MAG: hypothetical protein HRT69_14465 [Flavobacteriaceae bacterium]|nr:hypothetical protein [Flavobacteriaceae bacterium]